MLLKRVSFTFIFNFKNYTIKKAIEECRLDFVTFTLIDFVFPEINHIIWILKQKFNNSRCSIKKIFTREKNLTKPTQQLILKHTTCNVVTKSHKYLYI